MFTNANGCDSLITLNLTINNTKYSTDVIAACGGYTWNGVTYSSSNNLAKDTLVSMEGCDSIVTLDLTILQPSSGVAIVSTCDNYTWNGVVYTSSNHTALDTLLNAVGCDSIVLLDLTILNATSSIKTVTACDSYTFNGITYTVNNSTATQTLVNQFGCNSVITLDLTILNSSQFTDVNSSCGPIIWIDGITYDQTIIGPTFTILNNLGCDSVITLDFTLLDVDTSVTRNYLTLTAQANNATFQWIDCNQGVIVGDTNASFTPTVNGRYKVEVSQNGCVDTSDCFTITNVGIKNIELIGVSLYPNPTSDELNIDKGNNSSLEITITNSAGAMVYQSISQNQVTTINMAKMATGIYIVTLKNELGIKMEKVVKS